MQTAGLKLVFIVLLFLLQVLPYLAADAAVPAVDTADDDLADDAVAADAVAGNDLADGVVVAAVKFSNLCHQFGDRAGPGQGAQRGKDNGDLQKIPSLFLSSLSLLSSMSL